MELFEIKTIIKKEGKMHRFTKVRKHTVLLKEEAQSERAGLKA